MTVLISLWKLVYFARFASYAHQAILFVGLKVPRFTSDLGKVAGGGGGGEGVDFRLSNIILYSR